MKTYKEAVEFAIERCGSKYKYQRWPFYETLSFLYGVSPETVVQDIQLGLASIETQRIQTHKATMRAENDARRLANKQRQFTAMMENTDED